ncbi:hypothetical protein SAMN06265360_107181 [Haloechinothrix alba]|uniref:Uncharacterized protein n=1 Tax=Haloechinothrix alba TaxID=664784 RepID=A0A238WTN0_9PSEU|nr:hypothetical protein [Haloechinothrix alba]SNR49604.1 hypothetical protein SAMN06265360_107181 [Haloechinothrix alba]
MSHPTHPTTCPSFCFTGESEHDYDNIADTWAHTRHVGTVETTHNDLGGYDIGNGLTVSIARHEPRPIEIAVCVEDHAECCILTPRQALELAQLFVTATRMALEQAEAGENS